MSEETKVSNEAVVDSGAENNVQGNAQSELIAEIANSKKLRKRAQDAENQNLNLQKQLEAQANTKLKENEEYKTLATNAEQHISSSSLKEHSLLLLGVFLLPPIKTLLILEKLVFVIFPQRSDDD